jgi:hypothetical protein
MQEFANEAAFGIVDRPAWESQRGRNGRDKGFLCVGGSFALM